jgi:cytoskeletal protein RodZ
MSEVSAGQKLCEARLARNLSIDAAAHATKMRPDKILALENDDFTRFGGNAYAKGFLILYSRFLNVDVHVQLQELDLGDRRVNIEEYQYLNNAPERPPADRRPIYSQRSNQRRQGGPPSVLPLLGFLFVFLITGAYFYVKVYSHRLGLDRAPEDQTVKVLADKPAETTPVPAEATTEMNPEKTPSAPTDATEAPASSSVPVAAPAVAPAPAQAATEPAPTDNELSVEPLRTTYVTIRTDRNAPPMFADYLYPNGQALKVHGPRFFVEVRDQTAVQIRKNGQPIAYQAPGIWVN